MNKYFYEILREITEEMEPVKSIENKANEYDFLRRKLHSFLRMVEPSLKKEGI